MTKDKMIAFGITFSGSLVSAAKAVQLSKPTNIKMAIVAWTKTPWNEWNFTMSQVPENAHCVACSGLVHRYQIARPLKITRADNWITLIQREVLVDPVTPRYPMYPVTKANTTPMTVSSVLDRDLPVK